MAEDKKQKSTEVEEFLNEKEASLQAGKEKAPQKRWYIVHTYSGHENKVKVNLEKRIEYMNMSDKIFRVEVPQKTITKVKKLEGTDLVMELVRLTGGENDSEVAIKHAKELLTNSKTYKNRKT